MAQKQSVNSTKLRILRFYSLLAESWIGLYSDSISTSVGPFNRLFLPWKIFEVYELLITSSPDLPQETSEAIQTDFRRIKDLILHYAASSPDKQRGLLETNLNEREYLTKMTLDSLREAGKVQPKEPR